MLVLVLTLCALAACAHANCDACVAGLCHSRRSIVSGLSITDQLAIDRTNNVLYLQFNNYINNAIFLDDLKIRLVNMIKTRGKAVNQATQLLYMGAREVDDTIYTYNLVDNTTHSLDVIDANGTKPTLMFYGDNDLYFITNKDHLETYHMGMKMFYYKRFFVETMSDFVIGEDQKLFFVSNDNVYVCPKSPLQFGGYIPAKIIIRKKHVLSVDKYDTVYFADATKKVIYKRDKTTEKLEKYASYKSGSIEDFVFDKNNRIVFRDGNGVAQWVPTSTDRACIVGDMTSSCDSSTEQRARSCINSDQRHDESFP